MPASASPIAYHLTTSEAWSSTPLDSPFRPASLATDGFVHLTHRLPDLVEVANALYRDDPRPHIVLTVVLGWLASPWRYDGDERYPHVYGPIDRASIAEVRPMPRALDGTFLAPDASPLARPSAPDPEPDSDAFESMVLDALDGLPEAFRERLGSVAVVVEDEASVEQLAAGRAAGLFGLYQGVPRTAWGADQVAVPSKITIFRGPHLRRYGTGPTLAAGVADTVRHEVAHHFGISDDRLRELGRR